MVEKLTSDARFNFLRSPPDNVEIRLFATFNKLSSRNRKSTRCFLREESHVRSSLSSAIKFKCSVGVSEPIVTSNCGTKHEMFVIAFRSTSLPLIKILPDNGPRKRCEMLANRVVLPAPLGPSTATRSPLFMLPLTGIKENERSGYFFEYKNVQRL